MAASYPFFTASRNALDAITKLYDFVWPTAAALWNLRWQVAGYQQTRGTTTVDELRARFVEGSGIHGANLHRACLEHSWEKQQADLASVVLVHLFATHESWVAELVAELNPTLPKGFNAEKELQFPSSTDNQGEPRGVDAALQHLLSANSPATAAELQPVLAQRSGVHPTHVDEMLVVYRYFKECRNCLMHAGGKANQNAIDAMNALANLDPKQLPFKIPPRAALVLNGPVDISLYGVVGFSDTVRRVILTVDAELSASAAAEAILQARWQSRIGVVQLPGEAKKRRRVVAKHLRKLGLPLLRTTTAIEASLKRAGLVT